MEARIFNKNEEDFKPENQVESFTDNMGKLLAETHKKHEKVLQQFKFYLSNLDDFLSDIALCRNKEELEKDLKERKERQVAWVKSIIEEAQKNNEKEQEKNG